MIFMYRVVGRLTIICWLGWILQVGILPFGGSCKKISGPEVRCEELIVLGVRNVVVSNGSVQCFMISFMISTSMSIGCSCSSC